MLNPTQDLQIERLQEQLTLFKQVYEEKIRQGLEYSSLKPIEIHIRELERAIREFLSYH
jgi:hypothetical protein